MLANRVRMGATKVEDEDAFLTSFPVDLSKIDDRYFRIVDGSIVLKDFLKENERINILVPWYYAMGQFSVAGYWLDISLYAPDYNGYRANNLDSESVANIDKNLPNEYRIRIKETSNVAKIHLFKYSSVEKAKQHESKVELYANGLVAGNKKSE